LRVDKLANMWEGPYRIIKKLKQGSFYIQHMTNKNLFHHVTPHQIRFCPDERNELILSKTMSEVGSSQVAISEHHNSQKSMSLNYLCDRHSIISRNPNNFSHKSKKVDQVSVQTSNEKPSSSSSSSFYSAVNYLTKQPVKLIQFVTSLGNTPSNTVEKNNLGLSTQENLSMQVEPPQIDDRSLISSLQSNNDSVSLANMTTMESSGSLSNNQGSSGLRDFPQSLPSSSTNRNRTITVKRANKNVTRPIISTPLDSQIIDPHITGNLSSIHLPTNSRNSDQNDSIVALNSQNIAAIPSVNNNTDNNPILGQNQLPQNPNPNATPRSTHTMTLRRNIKPIKFFHDEFGY
jgi:hypothetical protein